MFPDFGEYVKGYKNAVATIHKCSHENTHFQELARVNIYLMLLRNHQQYNYASMYFSALFFLVSLQLFFVKYNEPIIGWGIYEVIDNNII